MKNLILSLLLLFTASMAVAQQTATYVVPKPADVAMYQVNPRVFAASNSLNAVAARIDSIRALGVNVMWVMPIFPIGEEKSKNSPYSIKDYKAVAPEFGTIEDFKNLVKVCHEHGMAIILDWVANHTAWDNAWVKNHPEWYTQENGEIIYPKHTDWTDVADLNYDNYYMRKAMISAMKFWIMKVGIDGFRCDVADAVPFDFWKDAFTELRRVAKRPLLFLAEGVNPDNFGKGGFDMNYAWGYKDALKKVFNGEEPASYLIDIDKKEYMEIPPGKIKMRHTTNHDQSTQQTPPVEFKSVRGSMAAYVAAEFIHGGLMVYGSQEVAYPNPINFFHYVPVDWTANPDIYKEYQKLISLYNDNEVLRTGRTVGYPDTNILAFERVLGDQQVLVLVNVTGKKQSVAVPEAWAKTTPTDMMTGKVYKLGTKATLKPYEYVIVKK